MLERNEGKEKNEKENKKEKDDRQKVAAEEMKRKTQEQKSGTGIK